MSKNDLTIVISGSFRRHLTGIHEKIKEFDKLGFKVLSPKISKPINPEEEFVILESDVTADEERLEKEHLQAIKEASVLYVFNFDGYLGNSVRLEIGYAIGVQKPIYTYEEVTEIPLKFFCKGATPEEIQRELKS